MYLQIILIAIVKFIFKLNLEFCILSYQAVETNYGSGQVRLVLDSNSLISGLPI